MSEYHKINTIFKRNMLSPKKELIHGEFSDPVFEYLANNEWEWTEKVDGTNIRIDVIPANDGNESPIYNGQLSFGGRTNNAQLPTPLFKHLSDVFFPQTAKLLEAFPDGATLYGEGFGGKIQKAGATYGPDQRFVLFDVKVGHWWLKRDAVEGIALSYGVPIVPIVGKGTLWQAIEFVEAGYKSQWGDFIAEGLVVRPSVELVKRNGERIIAKIKHRDFFVQ